MLASRDAQCNALSVPPPQTTSVGKTAVLLPVGKTAVLLPVGKTAVLLPEVVLVRRELLLASWHLPSLCSLFTAIPAAGRVLTACCWSHSLVPLPLGLRTAEGTGDRRPQVESGRARYLLYWSIGDRSIQ